MGTRPHLSFCTYKTAWLAQGKLLSMGSSPHQWFCAIKTAPLGSKLLVCMGPSPHVWLLDAKQRLLDWNYKALMVKYHTCCFCIQNYDFWTRITSLYGSQTWPVILCMYNSVLNIRITSLYGSQHSSVGFASKTATFETAYKSLWVPDLTCRFVHTKQSD